MRRIWWLLHGVGSVLCLSWTVPATAQRPTRDHYTPSVGLTGAASLHALRVDGATTPYEQALGWTGGAWLNLPLGHGISLEPQLHFAAMGSRVTAGTPGRPVLDRATVGFVSAPVLIKLHIGRFAALTVGAQADYPLRVDDVPNYWTTDSIATINVAAIGGVELFPHSRIALYGRYVYGLTDINRSGNPTTAPKVYVQGVQAGIKLRLTGRRVYADRDGDGLLDRADKCPTVVGLAKYAGCPVPDADRDGLADDIDACPSLAGDAEFRGCPPPPPPPDRDADGVIDAQDRCPTVAGERDFDGCPDTDHDGYEDARDKCPTIPGAVLPRGCPRLDGFRPSAVTFEPGTARLTAEGRTALQKVGDYLLTYDQVVAEVIGHTDNLGPLDAKIGLSVRRAEAARDYLTARGVASERLTVRGEGGRRPATSNRTREGRLLNQRIEVILR